MAGRNRVRYNGHPAWDRLDPAEWPAAELNGKRARAKQAEMLLVDLEHAVQWAATMEALVDEQLDDEAFTMRRLIALKEWEKSRHRAQKALNYRYNPLERRKHLIERDADRVLRGVAGKREKARVALEKWRARLEGEMVAVTALAGVPVPEVAVRRQSPRPEANTMHPGLAALDPLDRQLYQDLAPEADIATTPDDELRERWKTRNPGMSDDLIETVIGKINGTIPPLEELARLD